MLGPPSDDVPVTLILLTPEFNEAVILLVCHCVHDPVPPNTTPEATILPFTLMSTVLFDEVPFAYVSVRVYVPALTMFSVHSIYPPGTLS